MIFTRYLVLEIIKRTHAHTAVRSRMSSNSSPCLQAVRDASIARIADFIGASSRIYTYSSQYVHACLYSYRSIRGRVP